MRSRERSLHEEAREIFGSEDHDSIRRWVEYWQHSRDRNHALLQSFERLTALHFPDRRVLDIGCGTGGLGGLIGGKCPLYVGAEYNLPVLQLADSGLSRKSL